MTKTLLKFWACDRGATSIEYALIASIVSIGIIASLNAIAPLMQDNYNEVDSAFQQAN
jgi:Flp pilus assembly pilin Flp